MTPDLLAEAGYSYVLDWGMDDQPVYLRVRNGGRLLAVPYPQKLNDIPAIVRRNVDSSEFADMIVDTFDEMLSNRRVNRSRWGSRCTPTSSATRIGCGISVGC